jgi:cytochrome c biogenesis protein CcmG/thiol:disulfide interchange protein DsbE
VSGVRAWFRPLVVVTAVVVTGLVIAGLAVAVGSRLAAADHSLVGSAAPGLRGTTLTGAHYRLRPGSGQVTVVNIWAAWCPPCRGELPMLARLAPRLLRRGVRVVTIDTRDGPVAARSLLSQVHARDLVAVSDPSGRLAVSWGATGVPETVVVDGHGIVRGRWVGALSSSWLEDEVRRWS